MAEIFSYIAPLPRAQGTRKLPRARLSSTAGIAKSGRMKMAKVRSRMSRHCCLLVLELFPQSDTFSTTFISDQREAEWALNSAPLPRCFRKYLKAPSARCLTLYSCHWAALGVFPSRNPLTALPVNRLGGLKCCLNSCCGLSWRVARHPGSQGRPGWFCA